MKHIYASASVAALLCGGAFTGVATAQDAEASDDSVIRLEEIVVSSQRRQESIQDVPLAVMAFTPEDLTNRQIFDTKDLLQFIPNSWAENNTGLGSANTIFIRGLGNTESIATFDPPVGTYVDDVFIARQNANNFALFDIERIEVLRGPQGTLFGRNTTGGAVSIKLRDPGEELGGYAEVAYGRFNRMQARASVDLPVSENILTKFSAYYIDDDGYVDSTTTGEDLNDQTAFGVRGAVLFKLSESATWNVAVDYSEDDFANILNIENDDGDRVSATGFSKTGSALTGLVTGDKQNFSHGNEVRAFNVTSRLSMDIADNHSVEFITGYRSLRQDFAIDFFNAPSQFGGFTIANEGQHDQFTQEIKFNGTFLDDKLTYVAGAFYFQERNDTDFANILVLNLPTGPLPLVLADRLLTNDTDSLALFAQFDYALTDKLTLTAGLRWTDEEKTIEFVDNTGGNLTTAAMIAAGVPVEQNESIFTPRFALQYQANDDIMLFASATRGFKSGGWNARGTSAAELLPFDPEFIWSYEAGMRSDFLDKRLRVNVTGFYSDVSDFQLPSAFQRADGSLAFLTRNFADLENYGIEAEITALVTNELTLFANFGLQDGEQQVNQNDPDVDEFGVASVAAQQRDCLAGIESACGSGIVLANGSIAPAGRVPDFTLSAGFIYERDIPAIKGSLTFSGSVNFATEACINSGCDPNVNFDTTFQDDRALVNAGLVYRNDARDWEVGLECQNCFDESYNTAFLIFPYLNEPARWLLRVSKRFGN